MNLLEQITQDVIKDVSIGTTLRKAFILSSKLDNSEFKQWVTYEMEGYPTAGKSFEEVSQILPEYRISRVSVYATLTNGYDVVTRPILIQEQSFANTVFVGQGIASIEKALTESDSSTFYYSLSDAFVANIDAGGWRAMQAVKHYPRSGYTNIIETVKNRLLRFTIELEDTVKTLGIDLETEIEKTSKPPLLDDRVHELVRVIIMQGENNSMSTFDNRNQKVMGNQFNAAGDINFNGVQNQTQYIAELEKLQQLLKGELQANNVEEGTATDADYYMTKAVQEAKKPNADKATVLSHLSRVKEIITTVTALAGTTTAIAGAIEAVRLLSTTPH